MKRVCSKCLNYELRNENTWCKKLRHEIIKPMPKCIYFRLNQNDYRKQRKIRREYGKIHCKNYIDGKCTHYHVKLEPLHQRCLYYSSKGG